MADNIYTHSNVQFFVSTNAQDSDLTLQQFGQLSWTEVTPVGSLPERGIDTNMLTYDTVNTLVAKKAKGITDAGTGTLECARNPSDLGQILMSQIGAPNYFKSHAFKLIKQDGTVEYGRGLVAGPSYPGGRNEDFDIANFTIAYQQALVEDLAGAGSTTFTVTVHTGVSFFQLIVNGFATGYLADGATDQDIEDALNAITTLSGVTATVGNIGDVTFNKPASLSAIGADIT